MTTAERRRDRGFSLVVLLVGIVIVGLVATVIVIAVRGHDPPPTTAECDADRSALLRAERAFHTEHLRFGTEDELVAAGLLESPLPLQDVALVEDSFQVVAIAACVAAAPGATAPVAMQLVLNSVPDTVTAGRLIDPAITVTLTDDSGAVLADSTAEVTISLQAPNGAKLAGTTTVRAVAGVATFADLAIDKAGSGYSFVAEAAGVTATSAPHVAVNTGTPARLRFVASPTSATPGVLFTAQPIVAVEDVMGNMIETATDPIVLAITDNTGPSGGALTCDNLSVVPTAGVATFGGCQIDEPGTDYSLTAAAMGLTGRSDTFAVIGPATRLVVVQQPAPAIAGDFLSPTVVAVEDSAGNVVTDADATVTLTVNQNSDSLTGTTSVAVVDGIASFADLAIATSATDYTFTMSAARLKTATSAVFDVTTGPAAQLVFVRQPSGGKAGKSWSTQPIVTVADAFGNVVVTSVDAITLELTPGATSSVVLVCAENPLTAVNGEARFSKCYVDQPSTAYTLTATSAGLAAVSDPFSIT